MRFVPVAAIAAILLGAVAADPNALAGPAPSKTPKTAIFAANYYDVTAYPLGSNGDVPPIAVTTDFAAPSGIARDSSGRLYVTNRVSNTVTVYAADANGNVPPIAVIGGPHSRLSNPTGVALGVNGTIYVVNDTGATKGGSIEVFPPLAGSGILDESPVSEITGSKTLLEKPSGIALDSHGNIYVANESGIPGIPRRRRAVGTITVYAAGSTGNVAPIAVISGARTGLAFPAGIALDSDDKIYVLNFLTSNSRAFNSSITVYPAGSIGNVSPIATITGDNTNLIGYGGIAVDAAGNIYTGGCGPAGALMACTTVSIFAAGSDGDVAPTTTIFDGPNPAGIALDSNRNIYLLNSDGGIASAGEIIVYPAGSSGDAVPRATINDNVSGFPGVYGVGLDSTGTIYVADPLGGDQGSIKLYPPGSYAAGVPPVTSIAGPDTQLAYPIRVAVDRSGDIFALNENFVTEYPVGSTGDAVPSALFGYQPRGGEFFEGLAVNNRGELYVTVSASANCSHSCHQTNGGKVLIWPAGSNGGDGLEKPSAVITGNNTTLASPSGIAVDGGGTVYVTDEGPLNCLPHCGCAPGGPGSITIYAPGSTGDAKPTGVITGANTGLATPDGIALDSSGSIYVSNFAGGSAIACKSFGSSDPHRRGIQAGGSIAEKSSNQILVFSAGSNGNVPPIATIGGPLTGLAFSLGITIGPTGL